MARFARGKPHRDVSHDQERASGNEGTKGREHHHHFILSRPQAASECTDSLLRGEGGYPNPYTRSGSPGWSVQHPCELHRARNNPDGTEPATDSSGTSQSLYRDAPDQAPWYA